MAGRTIYSSQLAAELDEVIANAKVAKVQTDQGGQGVAGEVGITIFRSLQLALVRAVRVNVAIIVVSLLPLVALGLGTLLRAVGLSVLASAPALATLCGLAFFLPWQGWRAVRVARGRPPQRLFPRRLARERFLELPSMMAMAVPLIVGIASVPALLVLTYQSAVPSFGMAGLVALPVLVLIVEVALSAALSSFGGLGAAAINTRGSLVVAPYDASSLGALDERITRLTQMRDWLRDDTLRTMVDEVIGRHVKTSERRQVFYSIGIGILSLVAGWLLSTVSPPSTFSNFLHF